VIATQGGASEPPDTLLPDKAGGTAAVRRTLASTICRMVDPTQVPRPRQLRDASTVMRFRPAHQSMINRRHDGRASCLVRQSLLRLLPTKPQIDAPATRKDGHESALTHSDDSPSFQIVMPGLEPGIPGLAKHPPARGMAGSSPAMTILVNLALESDHSHDASRSCLGLGTCVGSATRQIVVARVLLTATAPPALPGRRNRVVFAAHRLPAMRSPVSGDQPAAGGRHRAMAQIKPASSRAIAAVTTLGGLPLRASLR
jgi:hypothetical protein